MIAAQIYGNYGEYGFHASHAVVALHKYAQAFEDAIIASARAGAQNDLLSRASLQAALNLNENSDLLAVAIFQENTEAIVAQAKDAKLLIERRSGLQRDCDVFIDRVTMDIDGSENLATTLPAGEQLSPGRYVVSVAVRADEASAAKSKAFRHFLLDSMLLILFMISIWGNMAYQEHFRKPDRRLWRQSVANNNVESV